MHMNLLRTLISSRPGLAWSTDIPEETATFVTNYTTELLNAGTPLLDGANT